jgi:non-heme chloroperoxidase
MTTPLLKITRREAVVGGAAALAASIIPQTVAAAPQSLVSSATRSEEITGKHMETITTKDGVKIFYKDWGSGQPIVFHHGWPLSSDDWDAQMLFFLSHGYRVVAHDRRGHGRSSQVGIGHDMDHYAAWACNECQKCRFRIGICPQCGVRTASQMR